MADWPTALSDLARLSGKTLFFVGGAPRSGTTWVMALLDAHPQIACRGEGLFDRGLARPLAGLMSGYRSTLEAKNNSVFKDGRGFVLPTDEDDDLLLGAAMMLGLRRQGIAPDVRAIGEKTPENVFNFPTWKRVFPQARFIGVVRDPRDVLTSAWHFFGSTPPGQDEAEAKAAFVAMAMPSIDAGMRAMVALQKDFAPDTLIVGYEQLLSRPEPVVRAMFQHLGCADDDLTIRQGLERTSFQALTGGRPAGEARNGAFLRMGVAGDWRTTFSEDLGRRIVHDLAWSFERFGWPT